MTEESTNEPVLTDDEKDALLDGMSSGEIEVHSRKGPSYASVNAFEVGPRFRIVTNSYPRLQSLNRQFAARVGKQIEVLLNAESTVTFERIDTCTYSEFSEQGEGLSLLVEVAPKPLQGSALISLDSEVVEVLVETFYGGVGNDPSQQDADFFTPGEINVANLFCSAAVSVIAEVWQPIVELDHEIVGSHLSSGVVDCVDGGDTVIVARFELKVGDKQQAFHIIWPQNTIASLVPVFDGQKRERDAAEDARWERSIRSRVVDSIVNISSSVGNTRMTLGAVAELEAGDVISISNPQKSTVFARHVPILEGRFGVHDGRHAIEAMHWLEPDADIESAHS